MSEDKFTVARHTMVDRQIRRRGITDSSVLDAMQLVARHRFVPTSHLHLAYEDSALPLALGQSISQPYMVAAMTEAIEPTSESRILEIGTGSGYQSAVLAEIVETVYTVERLPQLSNSAQTVLALLGYDNIEFRVGDGSLGWPEEAPFDGILVTAAAPDIPPPLLDQLADGACLVIPLGGPPDQDLYQIRREGTSFQRRFITRCRFVPLLPD